MVKRSITVALLLSASAAAAPPPPPPPPGPALHREVAGHSLARLFDDYRRHINLRVARRMTEDSEQLLAQTALPIPEPRDDVVTRPRSITFEVRGVGTPGPFVRAVATEFCADGYEMSGCQWIYAQITHRNNVLLESDFDAETAARQIAAAGIAAPAPGGHYPESIVDIIGASEELINSAFVTQRLSSNECAVLDRLSSLFSQLPNQVRQRLSDRPSPSRDFAVEHGPWLKVTFSGPMLEVSANSGIGQPEIVGDSWQVLEAAFRECNLAAWPTY